MKSEIQITNSAGVCRIEIEGTIGVPEEWQFDQPSRASPPTKSSATRCGACAGSTPRRSSSNIRSTGGDVNDALLIHDALCSLDAHIITRCYGYTASAATSHRTGRIARLPRNLGQRPLPDPHGHLCRRRQRRRDSGKLDLLRKTDDALAAVYAARSGRLRRSSRR